MRFGHEIFYRRRRRFGAGGEAGGGLASGEVGDESGTKYGFSDFSEFSIGAGLPSGLTLSGTVGNRPSTIAVADGGAEGNIITFDGHSGSGRWGMQIDAFDGLISQGEVLARVWIPLGVDAGSRQLAPAMNISGSTFATWDVTFGTMIKQAGTQQSFIAYYTNGSGGELAVANMQETAQVGVYAWVRFRKMPNAGTPTNDDKHVKTWFGGIGDEPAGWDTTITNGTPHNRTLGGVGVAVMFSEGDQLRVGYVSFTGDPSVIAPPVP